METTRTYGDMHKEYKPYRLKKTKKPRSISDLKKIAKEKGY